MGGLVPVSPHVSHQPPPTPTNPHQPLRPLQRAPVNRGNHPNHRHFAINRITGQQLSEVLKQVKPSAQGLDHIFAQDLKLLNTVALDWLAALYNNIEEGAPWPEPCLQVRTAYLSKPDGDPFKPQDYRNLSITSVTYRLWATTRLRDITPWAESWRIPGIFAGLPGVGAEEAWYITPFTSKKPNSPTPPT